VVIEAGLLVARATLCATAFAICCLGAAAGHAADAPPQQAAAAPRDFGAAAAKIIPGVTTAVQVQALLGKPWRQIVFGSGAQCPPKPFHASDTAQSVARNPDQAKGFNPYEKAAAVSAWDYRGRDSGGDYVLRVEFDTRYITFMIAKIPQAGVGVASVADSPAANDKPPEQP
jgi:hypothetical protein